MIKESRSLHKIPYYNLSTQQLDSVDKEKSDYQDIMCVCAPDEACSDADGRPWWGGYKYNFSYTIQPTMEPISYKLRGYKQNATLTYNNIGVDIDSAVMEEVSGYMNFIKDNYLINIGNEAEKFYPIVTDIQSNEWNRFENQSLQNKVFQKVKRIDQIGEVYSPINNLKKVCMGLNISSQIYLVNAQFAIIDWHKLGL